MNYNCMAHLGGNKYCQSTTFVIPWKAPLELRCAECGNSIAEYITVSITGGGAPVTREQQLKLADNLDKYLDDLE